MRDSRESEPCAHSQAWHNIAPDGIVASIARQRIPVETLPRRPRGGWRDADVQHGWLLRGQEKKQNKKIAHCRPIVDSAELISQDLTIESGLEP